MFAALTSTGFWDAPTAHHSCRRDTYTRVFFPSDSYNQKTSPRRFWSKLIRVFDRAFGIVPLAKAATQCVPCAPLTSQGLASVTAAQA